MRADKGSVPSIVTSFGIALCVLGCSASARPAASAGDAGTLANTVGADSSAAGSAGSAADGGKNGAAGTGSAGSGGNAGTGSGGNAGTGSAGSGGNVGTGSVGDAGTAGTGGVPSVGPVLTPGDPGAADLTFEVHADQAVHAISPLIYGTNGAPDIAKNRQTAVRSGGNRMTAYNWENNASNAGSDYMFQNDNYLSSSNVPGQVIADLVDTASAHGATALVTIPNVDYVSADENGGGDVRNSGANYLTTRFKQNKASKGSAFSATPDTSDAFLYQDEFVSWLKGRSGSASVFFLMDNEPDLWSSTHAEVHPKPVTYAELWDRNHRFAKAAKAVWPAASVLGFVSYGYNGFTTLQNASDAGGRNFIEWYLDQAKAGEAADGMRVIDYLDLHWYPEAQGQSGTRITESSTAADVVTAREQAPRSLWDATYKEKSWIANDVLNGPIDLLHWVQKKIDAHYPGTGIAISEWDYGAGNHISGAIADADVLGIFGREGVGVATYWPMASDESFAYAAFRAFRNYDGNGAAFGDTSISATTSDVANASVYASIDAKQTGRTVILAINKATTVKSAGIRISHSVSYKTAKVFVITSAQAEVVSAAALSAAAQNAFRYQMPAQSISVIVPEP